MRSEKKEFPESCILLTSSLQVKNHFLKSQAYQATLQLASVCVYVVKRPASAETRVSRCQKLQKVPSMKSAPLNVSFQKRLVYQEEKSSDQEQENVEQKVTISAPQAFPSMFMPYIEGPKWTGTVYDNLYNRFREMEVKMLKYIRMWTCNACRNKKLQERYCLVRRFWNRSICILVLATQRNCAWMSFGPNLKSCTNCRQMK